MNHTEPNPTPEQRTDDDDAWLDEALTESFPASDPLPWRHRDVTAPDDASD